MLVTTRRWPRGWGSAGRRRAGWTPSGPRPRAASGWRMPRARAGCSASPWRWGPEPGAAGEPAGAGCRGGAGPPGGSPVLRRRPAGGRAGALAGAGVPAPLGRGGRCAAGRLGALRPLATQGGLTRGVVLEEVPPRPVDAVAVLGGTARTARRPATRWVQRRSGGRWTGTAGPRRMRLFLGSSMSWGTRSSLSPLMGWHAVARRVAAAPRRPVRRGLGEPAVVDAPRMAPEGAAGQLMSARVVRQMPNPESRAA